MTYRKSYYFFVFFLILQILLQTTGCKKEYSYEGGDLTVNRDSIPPPVPVKDFPECSSCKNTDDVSLAKWNFKTGNSFLCGVVDEAGIDAEKKAFTLFWSVCLLN